MERKETIDSRDYIDKEYAHVQRILELKPAADYTDNVLSLGDLEIDPLRRRVLRKKEEIFLTATEFNILFYLASYPDIVFTHSQIYEAVWKRDYIQDAGNVTSHIGHIRKKIEMQLLKELRCENTARNSIVNLLEYNRALKTKSDVIRNMKRL